MTDTIEDIIRRIVREELAKASPPSADFPYFPTYWGNRKIIEADGRCAFCGADHGGLMCPQLQPVAVNVQHDAPPDMIDKLKSSKGVPL